MHTLATEATLVAEGIHYLLAEGGVFLEHLGIRLLRRLYELADIANLLHHKK